LPVAIKWHATLAIVRDFPVPGGPCTTMILFSGSFAK
jgi:hypothetical protein